MSTVLNDRDAILQAATLRIVNPKNAWINLQASAPGFHLNTAGQVDLGVVTVTADLIGLDDAVTFSAVGATLSNAGGRTVDVTYGGQTAIVTATVTSNGDEFKRSIVIPVLRDGAAGSTTYTWIKYADSAAGAGLSDDPTGKLYIGLAHNKSSAAEGTTAADYTWSLIKGEPGGQGVQGQKGADGQSLYTWIRYSDNPDGTGLYATPNANTMYIGLAVNRSSATPSSTKTDYAWSKFRGADGVGTAGARGAGHYYATGSSWSDVVAQAACPGSTPVLNDVVTISSSTYVMEKRWTGSAWVENGVVINGKLIAPDSILTTALAADIIKAKHLSVGAVLASHILVGPSGGLNKDPNFTDYAGSWSPTNAAVGSAGGAAPAPTYLGAFPGMQAFTLANELIPVDSTKTYLLSASVYADGGNDRNCTLLVNFYDGAGNRITNTGWGDANFSGHATSFRPAVGDWRPYRDGVFGAKSAAKKIPANAKTCRVGVYLNGGGSSNTMMGVTALLLEEMIDSALVVKGGIKADNIDVETLSAIIAYLGSCEIGPGGNLRQGMSAFNVGKGIWLGDDSGVPKLAIGDPGGAGITWDGVSLAVNKADFGTFTAVLSGGGMTSSGPNGSRSLGSRQITGSGGRLPYRGVSWAVTDIEGNAGARTFISGESTDTVSVTANGTNATTRVRITGTIIDANGLAASASFTVTASFGTV